MAFLAGCAQEVNESKAAKDSAFEKQVGTPFVLIARLHALPEKAAAAAHGVLLSDPAGHGRHDAPGAKRQLRHALCRP